MHIIHIIYIYNTYVFKNVLFIPTGKKKKTNNFVLLFLNRSTLLYVIPSNSTPKFKH